MKEKLDNMNNMFVLEREKTAETSEVPKKLAVKVQLLYTKEERILREEYILNKLSKVRSIKNNIPRFYYGCTFNFNGIRLRMTFMEFIDNTKYYTIARFIENGGKINDDIYDNVKKIAMKLWKHGVSHNDLSMNNILLNVIDNKDIKLIDFGLSQVILPDKVTSEQSYVDYFKDLDNSEQSGSNVAKLKDLFVKKI